VNQHDCRCRTEKAQNGVLNFDREKCVHCGACLWNCASASLENPERMAVAFRAGTGGLHSAEN
jgi:electron-transferring-flavoprotein dehydrogenase